MWRALRTRVGTTRMCRDAYLDLVSSRAFLDRVGRDEAAALIERLFGDPVGRTVPLLVLRGGGALDLSVALVERAD